MKRMIVSKAGRAKKVLSKFNKEAVDYVSEFKDEIDNLTVVDVEVDDIIEVDPSDTIDSIEYRYISFGIDEGIIDDAEDFETIYEALCMLEGSEE